MKIGNVEGTPKQIKDFFEDHGLSAKDYFIPPPKRMSREWLLVAVGFYVLAMALLALLPVTEEWQRLLFLLGCAAATWVACAVQMRFGNAFATGAVLVMGLLLMMVAYKVITPREFYGEVQQLRKAK